MHYPRIASDISGYENCVFLYVWVTCSNTEIDCTCPSNAAGHMSLCPFASRSCRSLVYLLGDHYFTSLQLLCHQATITFDAVQSVMNINVTDCIDCDINSH